MTSPRVWFITGASSGFGRKMAELALSKGEIVVATARRPERLQDLGTKYDATKLVILSLDVSKKDEIVAAFSKTNATFGRVDVVFNNAGWGMIGEVEGTDEETARRNFDTNFWGATNVSREALKAFRKVNPEGQGGRLIVTSSETGIQGYPAYGYYCASKHALEGVHDALAKEIDPEWNVKITLVEPGYFATEATPNMVVNGARMAVHPAYTKPSLAGNAIRNWQTNGGTAGADPSLAVIKIYELSLLQKPPLRLPIGADCVEALRTKAKEYAETVDEYASWSDNLEQVTVVMK